MLKKYCLSQKILFLFIILCLAFVMNYFILFYFIDKTYAYNQFHFGIEDVLFSLLGFMIAFCLLYSLYGMGKYYFEFEEITLLQQYNQIAQENLNKMKIEERNYYEQILTYQKKIMNMFEQDVDIFQELDNLENMIQKKNIFFCDNQIIDAVISTKSLIMSQKNIDFSYQISLPPQLDIKDIDISTILFNLLDNAIYACDYIEMMNKRIFLEIFYQFHMLKICVKNNYNPSIKRKYSQNHGYGLKIINDIVNVYHGEIQINQNQDIFEVDICLYGGTNLC